VLNNIDTKWPIFDMKGREQPGRFGAFDGKKQTFVDRTVGGAARLDPDKICYQE
jgi:hypothetical protein